jgi:glycosyltransferase involved in cell wall biosynthesis
MRLLHIHSGNLYGGVETLVRTLAQCRQLCPQMYPEFALCFEDRIAAELRQIGATVHILGRVRARNPAQIIEARRRLVEILNTRRFDAAICHMAWPLAIFAPAVRHAGVPLVAWMHDASLRPVWLRLLARRCSPDLIICNSQYTASSLSRFFSGAPSETLYYPVLRPTERADRAEREATRGLLGTTPEAVVILQASRMEPWKGQLVLLEALAQLTELPQWACWIAGGAQRPKELVYEKTLRARANTLGLSERVAFLGQRSDVARLMGAADIYCQPNIEAEPFGIAFIEAMNAGLPVVTTDAGASAEIVDASCGVVMPANDADSLAAKLRALLKEEGLRRRLGSAGKCRASQLCDPAKQLWRLHAVINQTLEQVMPQTATPL